MLPKFLFATLCLLIFSCRPTPLLAQDKRTQYPSFLSKSYVNVNLGYINFPFSNEHLESGYAAESVQSPHLALQVVLGHQINKNLSARLSYLRPVNNVLYRNINGNKEEHGVWLQAVGGLTIQSKLPLTKKLVVKAETGLGIISRTGFTIDEKPVVKDANYATLLSGAGVLYQINKKWDIELNAAYLPARSKVKQPETVFFSGGLTYNLSPLPADKVEKNSSSGYIFPKQLFQFGYTTNRFGYAVNNFLSKGALPIFWGGAAEVEKGFAIRYMRNVFHTRKVFALDIGTGLSYWKSNLEKEGFYTISAFPLLRFTALRMKAADFYLFYSVAGPTFISKEYIDGLDTGNHFTFQDFMGMGIFTGKKRNINAEININHYSNGNIFTSNAGVKIPLSFTAGFAF